MVVSFPESLPYFRVNAYSYSQKNTIQRTEFRSGFVRPRRQFNKAPLFFDLHLRLSTEQLGLFESWRYHVLKDIGWFSAKVKTGSMGVHDRELRFTGNGEKKQLLKSKQYWELSFQCEARKQKYMTEEATVLALGVPSDFGTQVQNVMEQYYE